jgi:hypothetical protein
MPTHEVEETAQIVQVEERHSGNGWHPVLDCTPGQPLPAADLVFTTEQLIYFSSRPGLVSSRRGEQRSSTPAAARTRLGLQSRTMQATIHWGVTEMAVNMRGRAFLFKIIFVQQKELHQNFDRVPARSEHRRCCYDSPETITDRHEWFCSHSVNCAVQERAGRSGNSNFGAFSP